MQGSPHRGHISDAFRGLPTSVGSLIFRRVIKDCVSDASNIFPSVLYFKISRGTDKQVDRQTHAYTYIVII